MGTIKYVFLILILSIIILCCSEEKNGRSEIRTLEFVITKKEFSSSVLVDTLIFSGYLLYNNFYENKILPDSIFTGAPVLEKKTELNVQRIFSSSEYNERRALNSFDLCRILARMEKYPVKHTDEELDRRAVYIQEDMHVSLIGKLNITEQKYNSYLISTLYRDQRLTEKRIYVINTSNNNVISVFMPSAYFRIIPHGYSRQVTRTNGQYFLLEKEFVEEIKPENESGTKNRIYAIPFYLDENGFVQLINKE